MSEAQQTRRISKVASELNVGVQTVIDFLTDKKFEDINRNSKISDEMYAMLLKEYGAEKSVKEESKKIIQTRLKREPVVLDENHPSPTKSDDTDQEPDEILVKGLGQRASTPTPPPLPTPIPEPEKAPVVEPEPVIEPEPIVVAEIVKEDIETPAPVEEKIISPVTEVPSEPVKENQLKVLGKIDLDSFDKNRGKKSGKDSKEKAKEVQAIKPKPSEKPVEIAKPAPEVTPEAKKEVVQEVKAEEPAKPAQPIEPAEPVVKQPEELFRAAREKLEGVKILGKIELAPEPPKKPIASSSGAGLGNNDRKKKRKRIDSPAGNAGNTGNANPSQNQGGSHPNTGPNREIRPRQGGQGSHRPAPGAPKPQLTEEEVQKQIKETLARLSQGKQKSKSAKYRKQKREDFRAAQEEAEMEGQEKIIKVTEFVSANELARMMNVPVNEIISTCMSLGLFVSINQRLDAETLTIVAEEFGYKVEFVSVEVQEAIKEEEDTDENLVPRPPIVTVMGHVDHGKTSLLDYVRKANVIAGEAGGITQHIGAYNVTMENGKKITFLDTPGHEAFTAMRARGAQVTDVAIIVIAADDSVMPQTIEAINHAQAAQVPIVFAINKIDKPGANPDKIREQLAAMNILVEDWGGKYQIQEIAAKHGKNVDLLLEKVLLEAELLDLKANPDKRATGTVIESELDKGRGYVTTMIILAGTLRIGDVVLAGPNSGRVKALFNERGASIKEAGPSMSVQMLGLSGAPSSGDKFNVMSDEREAREIANKRQQLQREQGIRTHKHITLDEIGRRIAIGDFKELNIIVKGDVDGSVEALSDSLLKLSTEKIQVNIIHKSVGQVTEGDVLLASASNAIIIGFQVRPSASARKLAENEEIDMRFYSIIYKAIEEIKSAMEGMLAPEFEEKIVCNVEVRDVFKITKVGTVAGCYVLDGKITRNTKIRLIRDGIVVYSGDLGSLKRFKDDVKEVATGYECGLNIHNFNDIKEGDIIEGYENVEIKRKL
ncbi:MAG TPA: translation initiation factor IF-2 [Flavobacteriales bacterium]|nr:translation initiation factor IF-2 [Flavobacteriales bacterium]